MAGTSLTGRLLVANPLLPDANFDRTVVLMVAHGPDGALGLVLNRPSEMPLDGPLPAWRDLASPPAEVFVGGPVNPEAAICLARRRPGVAAHRGPAEGWTGLVDGTGTLDLGLEPGDVADELDALRVFAGYSGWGSGQLEGELDADAWWVVDALPDDPFGERPEELWKSVLRRQPGELRMVSAFPGRSGEQLSRVGQPTRVSDTDTSSAAVGPPWKMPRSGATSE